MVGGGHLVRGGEAEYVGGGGEEEDGGDRRQDSNLQAEVRLLIICSDSLQEGIPCCHKLDNFDDGGGYWVGTWSLGLFYPDIHYHKSNQNIKFVFFPHNLCHLFSKS